MNIIINLFFFIFGVIGITNVIVDSDLFCPVRDLFNKVIPSIFEKLPKFLYYSLFPIKWINDKIAQIVTCHQCAGCWVGFLCGWTIFGYSNFFMLLIHGGPGSALASGYYILSEYIISKSYVDIKD